MDVAYLAYTTDPQGKLQTSTSRQFPIYSKQDEAENQNNINNNKKKDIDNYDSGKVGDDLNFRQVLSPLIKALLFFAVDVRPNEEVAGAKKRGCFVARILPAIHILIYIVTCILFYFTLPTDSANVKKFSANMAKGLCITAFFATHVFFYFRRHRISQLLDGITKSLTTKDEDQDPPPATILTNTRWMALALVPMPFVLLILAYCFYQVGDVIQEAYFSLLPKNESVVDGESAMVEGVTMMFFFFFAAIFSFFVYAVGLFCLIIRTLKMIVNRLKCPGVVSGSVSVALNDVANFLKLHEVVCRLVTETDDSFKEVACVWCTVEMTCAVLFGRSANVNFKDTPEFDFVLAFIVIILLFVYKVLSTATVNDSVITSLKEISYVDENTLQDLSPRSAALATKIKLYIQHVMVSSPTITGWSLFTIDKAVVLSAAGSILTYILVLYDK